jgi:Na+-translocating ferredoxin:NAD+ oxidoreductase subunit G
MTDATQSSRALPVMDEAVPSWKLLLTLTLAGAVAGLAVVLLYDLTLPRIEAYKAGVLRTAIAEVLHAPHRADTLWLQGGALTATRPPEELARKAERVYRGYDDAGRPVGYAISVVEPGFSEAMHLLIGYDAATHQLLGMKVLESKETPGIADKIELPVFTKQFAGRIAPLVGLKSLERDRLAHDPSAVLMITGATISSRAVMRGINRTIDHWQPYLAAYRPAPGRS